MAFHATSVVAMASNPPVPTQAPDQAQPPATSPSQPQGVKIYQCPTCDRVFNKKANLKVHSRKHTGEKPYACSRPGCGKRFMWKSSVTFHEQNCDLPNRSLQTAATQTALPSTTRTHQPQPDNNNTTTTTTTSTSPGRRRTSASRQSTVRSAAAAGAASPSGSSVAGYSGHHSFNGSWIPSPTNYATDIAHKTAPNEMGPPTSAGVSASNGYAAGRTYHMLSVDQRPLMAAPLPNHRSGKRDLLPLKRGGSALTHPSTSTAPGARRTSATAPSNPMNSKRPKSIQGNGSQLEMPTTPISPPSPRRTFAKPPLPTKAAPFDLMIPSGGSQLSSVPRVQPVPNSGYSHGTGAVDFTTAPSSLPHMPSNSLPVCSHAEAIHSVPVSVSLGTSNGNGAHGSGSMSSVGNAGHHGTILPNITSIVSVTGKLPIKMELGDSDDEGEGETPRIVGAQDAFLRTGNPFKGFAPKCSPLPAASPIVPQGIWAMPLSPLFCTTTPPPTDSHRFAPDPIEPCVSQPPSASSFIPHRW